MTSPVELTIRVKGEEKKRLSDTYLVYDRFEAHQDDPIVKRYIAETLKGFVGEACDVEIRTKSKVI